MPKFGCRCGTRMNFSSGWTDNERSLVNKEVINHLVTLLDEDKLTGEDEYFDIINERYHRVIYCLDCLRLYVEWDGEDYYLSHIRECEKKIEEGGYHCSCGCSLENLDSDHTMVLLHEGVMEKAADVLSEGKLLSPHLFYEITADMTFPVLKCPECNRLHMKIDKNTYAVYVYEFAGQEDLER